MSLTEALHSPAEVRQTGHLTSGLSTEFKRQPTLYYQRYRMMPTFPYGAPSNDHFGVYDGIELISGNYRTFRLLSLRRDRMNRMGDTGNLFITSQ